LKKRKVVERAAAAKRAQDILEAQKNYKRPRKGELQYRSAESFVKQHRNQRKAVTRRKRNASIPVDDYLKDTYADQLVFVIRVRGMNALEPKAKRVLGTLRLLQMNQGVFMKADKKVCQLLKQVDPYVSFGYPSAKMIEELIYKRGYGNIDKRRVALNDNKLIEEALGESTGMICVEDIVHQITTVGEHFDAAAKFLWPFKLKPIKKKPIEEDDTKGKKKPKIFGNQKEKINDVIKAMM